MLTNKNDTKDVLEAKNDVASMKRKAITAAGAVGLAGLLVLTGCSASTTSINTSSSSSSNNNYITVSQTSYEIEMDAVNTLCNGALRLTVTDMQRRPTSIFSGSSISGSNLSGSNSTEVTGTNTTDIAIQIDVSYTWNINTYTSAVTAAGGDVSNEPGTLGDLLNPGTLMYIQGTDSDGNVYQTADVIVPSSQDDVNQLAINSQWDYDVLNSDLPETSVTKTGSILMRVASTAKDLELVIITPTSGQDAEDEDAVMAGNIAKYVLPLT